VIHEVCRQGISPILAKAATGRQFKTAHRRSAVFRAFEARRTEKCPKYGQFAHISLYIGFELPLLLGSDLSSELSSIWENLEGAIWLTNE
jgi:hypothetical protein